MILLNVVVGQLDVNCFIISDGLTSETLIIDPGDEPEKIIEVVDANGLKPHSLLFTHAHYDHVCAVKELHDRYQAIILMHGLEKTTYEMTTRQCISWGYSLDDFPWPERTISNGETISVGSLLFTVIHTPGHTPGSICLYGQNTLFTGDTLFKGSVGRTDLPGGDAELLCRSLSRLALLPARTRVLCGHDDETTMANEMKDNPFLREI